MVQATLQSALGAHQRGDLAAAIEGYRKVLAQNPDHADAQALLGVALSAMGQHDEALALLSRALETDPSAALFKLHYGNALMEAGRLEESAAIFREGLAQAPGRAEFPYNLANVLRQMGQWEEAGELYEKAVSLAPSHAQARNNLASVLAHFERFEEALVQLREVLQSAPDYFDAWLNLCNFAEKAGHFALAHEAGVNAATLQPQNESAWLGLGVALNKLGRDEEALVAYREAVRLKPDWTEVWDNIGQTLQFLGRLGEAEEAYRKTIDLAGQSVPDADVLVMDEKAFGNRHWHLALLELLKGDLRHGFARYRARFGEVGGLERPVWPQPVWRGQELAGRTILVLDEQGMGDTLMLARYLPMLKARGAKVVLHVHPALAPVFEGWDGVDFVIPRGQRIPDFDFYATTFDLPFAFQTTMQNIPALVPYLPRLVPDEKTRLPDGGGRKVGIAWAGAPLHKHDARRSLPLSLVAALFDSEAVQFYSFNRDKRDGDDLLLAHHKVVDLADRLHDFGDTARFMDQMDLIISCDTSTAHLAGALGKPVWTLLPYAPDWRWLTGRADSPWYPTMRLFRQSAPADWAGVVGAVRQALHGL